MDQCQDKLKAKEDVKAAETVVPEKVSQIKAQSAIQINKEKNQDQEAEIKLKLKVHLI